MVNLIAKIYQSQKTVLNTKDLALLWNEVNPDHLKAKIAYYVKQGTLTRLRRSLFILDQDYNPKELATHIYTPSYISFETVLREAGIIFQYYKTIFVAGPWPRTIAIDSHTFTFRKLKANVLYNSTGVRNENHYSIATPERAFLDTLYLFPNYYFDNLRGINWDLCFEWSALYNNQQLIKRLKKYYKNHVQ